MQHIRPLDLHCIFPNRWMALFPSVLEHLVVVRAADSSHVLVLKPWPSRGCQSAPLSESMSRIDPFEVGRLC